jgi:lycopene cyclase domain-containing protein
MSLYLILEILAISIPLILSFDKKVRFYGLWKYLFPSIIITGVLFISIDIIFTKLGIWGFNPAYHSKIMILNLPLEEWLFFIVIPYASLFIHFVLIAYKPDLFLSNKVTRILSGTLTVILVLVMAFNPEKTYTLVYFSVTVIVTLIDLLSKARVLNRFFISFLIILVPFFIVNVILTGTFINEEVVWYDGSEILGISLLTIPVEDISYAFSLILLNLLLMSMFRRIIKGKPD